MSKSKGQVWKIAHERKGKFTVRLLEDVADGREWFAGEIVEGVARRVANHDKEVGEKITLRQSFVTWIEAVPND